MNASTSTPRARRYRSSGGIILAGNAGRRRLGGMLQVIATPWVRAPSSALKAAGPLEGKVIWSIVNPFKPDLSGLALGPTTSGSEELAKLDPRAAFVAGWPPGGFHVYVSLSCRRSGIDRHTRSQASACVQFGASGIA